jgi:ABC-2 type transport system permease protein
MKKALAVARWEYIEKIKSKAFIIGLFLTPIIMLGMAVLPTLFVSQEDTETKTIGLIDRTGDLAAPFAERMQKRYTLGNGRPNYIVYPIAVGSATSLVQDVAEANAKVVSGEIEGYCMILGEGRADSVVEYRSKSVGDFQVGLRIEEILRGLLEEKRISALGLDPGVLKIVNAPLSVKTVKLSNTGEEEEAGFLRVFFTAYGFCMILLFLIATSGQMLVRSVIEEKANRIVEVLVSSCSPTELMAGKVIGLSGLGFTQMAFWVVIGVAVSVQFGISLIEPVQALLLIVYFVLGYLFYAAVFIGAGSPLTTEQEAQQVNSYLILLLIVPVVLAFPAMKSPDAIWLKVLSFVPLLTPSMMALRIPIQMPSLWEILATMVTMVGAIYICMVAAGRIFRIGVLSTGKSPKLKEIIRWARTG